MGQRPISYGTTPGLKSTLWFSFEGGEEEKELWALENEITSELERIESKGGDSLPIGKSTNETSYADEDEEEDEDEEDNDDEESDERPETDDEDEILDEVDDDVDDWGMWMIGIVYDKKEKSTKEDKLLWMFVFVIIEQKGIYVFLIPRLFGFSSSDVSKSV